MACNPTRLELSNSATTTVQVTIATDPGDGTAVTLQVDELSIDQSQTTSSGVATFTIAAVSAANNSIWDATIQVGSNSIAAASVQVVETNVAQTVGVTVSDANVTYCAPTGGGGTGDASTANPISQFSDVSYTSPRDADILSRAVASTWTAQRPEYLWVDRRPLMVAHYGATDSQPENFGVATSSHRLTPVSGSADHTSTSLNGRIDFLSDRFVTPQSANTEKIKRYVVGTPSGYVGGPTHDSYPSTAGYIIANDPDDAETYNSDGTVASTFDTPFTDDGTTTGNKGDQQEAWTAALTWFRNELSDFVLELTAYIGYFVIFEPDASGNPTTTYKTDINGYDNDWDWSVKPTVADVDGFFGPQWTTFEAIGFDTMGFDLGTNVWSDTGTSGRALIDEFIDLAGERVMFEAVPRTSDGQQLDDIRAYRNARYWFYFPALAEIDGVNASSPSSTRIRVDDWNLDPSCTEVHVVFDWFQCANASQLNLSGTRIRELMDIAHERGFVVSTTGGASPAAASDGWTVAEFHQYAIDLWKRTRGLDDVVAGTGTVTSVGLTMPTGFTVTGSPVTSSGTLGVTWDGNADTVTGPVLFTARNVSGGTMTKGQVVFISGHSGTESQVDLADADDATAMPAFGLVNSATVPNNAEVEIVTFGEIIGMDTDGFNVGDVVYVSTTPGELTATPPTGESSLIQNMGKVVRSHATEGIIKVIGAGRTNATPNLDQDKVFLGNASNQAVSTALSAIGLSKFNDDLPAVSDSYLMLIEAPADKSGPGHVIDGRVAAARTIVSLYARTAAGSCTVTLNNVTSTPETAIASVNANVTGATNTSPSNTSVSENDRLAIAISSSSGTPEDLEIVVEYTQ